MDQWEGHFKSQNWNLGEATEVDLDFFLLGFHLLTVFPIGAGAESHLADASQALVSQNILMH